jgi:hypothetical protein
VTGSSKEEDAAPRPSLEGIRWAARSHPQFADPWLTRRWSFGSFSLQPISATDLRWEFMNTGPGDLHARCVRCEARPQPSHGDADGRAPGAVDGPGDRALVGRRQALRASELADEILSPSGAQT